jgi:hypothetical protein
LSFSASSGRWFFKSCLKLVDSRGIDAGLPKRHKAARVVRHVGEENPTTIGDGALVDCRGDEISKGRIHMILLFMCFSRPLLLLGPLVVGPLPFEFDLGLAVL